MLDAENDADSLFTHYTPNEYTSSTTPEAHKVTFKENLSNGHSAQDSKGEYIS